MSHLLNALDPQLVWPTVTFAVGALVGGYVTWSSIDKKPEPKPEPERKREEADTCRVRLHSGEEFDVISDTWYVQDGFLVMEQEDGLRILVPTGAIRVVVRKEDVEVPVVR